MIRIGVKPVQLIRRSAIALVNLFFLGAPAIGLEREQAVDLQKRTEEGRVPRSISEGSMNGGRTCQVRSVLTRGDLKNGKHVQIRRTTLTPSSGLR